MDDQRRQWSVWSVIGADAQAESGLKVLAQLQVLIAEVPAGTKHHVRGRVVIGYSLGK
jgi:hypothetical protein